MARLNTTAVPKTPDPRLRRKNSFQSSPASSGAEPRASTSTSTKEAKLWTMGNETSSGGDGGSGRIPLPKSQSQRSRKGKDSGGCFDIFPDADEMGEREDGDGQSPRMGGDEGTAKHKSKSPLKSAKVNSLLLPVPEQTRSRPTRKSEVDYDKENDVVEGEMDDFDTGSTGRERQSQIIRDRGLGQARNGRQLNGFREPESEDEAASGSDSDSEDNGFDSMDDFIVSDNEELSFYETSEGETEATPPPSPPARRRFFRGRRPDPGADVKRNLESPPQKTGLRLEPSLPSTLPAPSLLPDSRPEKVSQDEQLDIDEDMSRLSLGDNDVSSQLEKDLQQVVEDPDSSPQQSDSGHEILQTPPSSPSKNRILSPTKLSPSKRKVDIPTSPHRESADAFWSQELTNDWVDQHSPRKLEQLLRDFEDSDNDASDTMVRSRGRNKPKTPSKTALKRAETEKKKAQLARRKSFDNKKTTLAENFLKVLDDAATGGQIQELTEETGGVKIVWSKTLQKTAGRANWKRKNTAYVPLAGLPVSPSQPYPCTYPAKDIHWAYIELAERIIDDEDRLINTLAHEYCHLTNFMISGVRDNPHGTSFKQWGRRTEEALKDHPVYGGRITVTTKHNYEIDYKYVWNCVDCRRRYGRHSKSIDTTRSRCSLCKGSLEQIKPKPRNVSPRKPGVGQKKTVDDMAAVLGEVSLHN